MACLLALIRVRPAATDIFTAWLRDSLKHGGQSHEHLAPDSATRNIRIEPPVRATVFKLGASAVLLLLLLLAWFAFHVTQSMERPLAFEGEIRHHIIAPGSSFSDIAAELERVGIVGDRRVLEIHARWHGLSSGVQAGEYAIDPAMTPHELLLLFHTGKVVQHSLTLVEGWTFSEVLHALRATPELEHTLGADLGHFEIMREMGYEGMHPEGRFLADTYHFPRGTSDVAFLRRAYRSMQEFLENAWEDRVPDLPYDSPMDALVVASIVEKETGKAEERPQIAGVLVRRLKKNMRLEADPTVIYGLGDEFDGNLRKSDLRKDTPYNTYVHRGLPPTPIAMPGSASILAALHPLAGDALFFVAKGDGSHYFSATYREHLEAVARYQAPGRTRSTGGDS